MIDSDIDDIREEIKDLPYEDKLAILEDKESELDEIVEEQNGYISDISSLKDEIQTEKNDKMCKQVLQSLKDNGYNMELDNNGNLTFPLGLADITIIMHFLDAKDEFYFNLVKANSKSVNLSVPFCLSSRQMEISIARKCQKTSASVLWV